MNQTVVEKYQSPDGLSMEVTTDDFATFTEVGAMEDGCVFVYEHDAPVIELGNAENTAPLAKNQKLQMTPSNIASWTTDFMESVMGGVFTRTAVAGTPVAGATDTHSSGEWAKNTAILLSGQNGAGTVPTINSVTGSVDGALALGTGYEMVQVLGGWAITYLTAVVTLAQDIVVDYDYTPAATFVTTAGSSSTQLSAVGMRFTHYLTAARTIFDWRIDVFRVFTNGGLTLNKLGAKTGNDLDMWQVALTGEIDSGLADGSQLFKLTTTT